MPINWLRRNVKIHDEARAPLSRFGLWGLITVIVAGIALGSYVAAKSAGRSAGERAVEVVRSEGAMQLAKGCNRTQVQRGYLLLRAREFTEGSSGAASVTTRLAPHLFQVLWCDRTYAPGYTGPTIYLPHAASQCFLKLEAEGYWNDRDAFTDPARLGRACANR